MLCVFGTRLTYKEYFTQTFVTERKVIKEESNWEEFIANRLEEDEKNIASLTDNYARMTEMYGKLLETTAELSTGIQSLRIGEVPVQSMAVEDDPYFVTPNQEQEQDISEYFDEGASSYLATVPVAKACSGAELVLIRQQIHGAGNRQALALISLA